MASFLAPLLGGTPYSTIFGNALTAEEIQARPAVQSTTGLDMSSDGLQNYIKAMVNASNAENSVKSLQKKVNDMKSKYNNARSSSFVNINGESVPGYIAAFGYKKQLDSLDSQLKSAQKKQTSAQDSANALLNQAKFSSGAQTANTNYTPQAVQWGKIAQTAENNMIGQAREAARTAQANEATRMASLSGHPLLGSGIR